MLKRILLLDGNSLFRLTFTLKLISALLPEYNASGVASYGQHCETAIVISALIHYALSNWLDDRDSIPGRVRKFSAR
jgi:hypothetical protein